MCDDVAAGRRRLHISSLSVSAVKPPPPPAWIMQKPPPDWQTPLNGIKPTGEAGSLCKKQLEGTQKHINECADRVAHIDGQIMQLL